MFSFLVKKLWAARLARPDISRATTKLASNVSTWSRNDDRRLKRLMEYMSSSIETRLVGFICDLADDLELWLFVDADLASEADSTRSTSGAWLTIVGPSTWMPVAWINAKQTSTSRSTTESESVALATALLKEASLTYWRPFSGAKLL